MKRFTFLLACIVGMAFFASCNPDQIDDLMNQKPGIEFVSGDGYISSNTSAYVGTELKFLVRISPNSASESALSTFKFDITDATGTTLFSDTKDLTDSQSEVVQIEEVFTPTNPGILAATAYISDASGKENAAVVTIDYVTPTVAQIGTFEGDLALTGHIIGGPYLGQQIDQDIDTVMLHTVITMGALEDDGRVSATFEIDGTPVTLYATKTDEAYVFDEFHFTKTITVITDFKFELYVNAIGVIENDVMTLHATTQGAGHIEIQIFSVEADMTGEINGPLSKVG